jgi:hypothetical protein
MLKSFAQDYQATLYQEFQKRERERLTGDSVKRRDAQTSGNHAIPARILQLVMRSGNFEAGKYRKQSPFDR